MFTCVFISSRLLAEVFLLKNSVSELQQIDDVLPLFQFKVNRTINCDEKKNNEIWNYIKSLDENLQFTAHNFDIGRR